jgi:hypothetical protein
MLRRTRCYKERPREVRQSPGPSPRVLAVTDRSLPKSVHIEGNIEPTGVDMSSQNSRLYGRFVETRLPDQAIRVGEVPGSNPGAPIQVS